MAARTAARSRPLVGTWARWAATSVGTTAAFVVALSACLAFVHSPLKLGSFKEVIAVAGGLAAVLLFFLLRAEDARLARELRTARTGTAALRTLVLTRKQRLPFFASLFSTDLGRAAVLLAAGDREGAASAVANSGRALQGGRLSALRAIVEADLDRADGSVEGLDRCIEKLRAGGGADHREADLYALHVLVKAILERGDIETAEALAREVADSTIDEERLYGVWLRAWFDFDGAPAAWAPLSEGELRLAALVARAHGAGKLVEKLEQRLEAVARGAGEE